MINPDEPVTLKKHALCNGTFYHPREYQPGELPPALLSPEYVTQGSPLVVTFDPFAGTFETTNITISVETPNNEKTTYGTSTVIVPASRIQINEATIEAIAALDGISITAAKKLVEERVKAPFISLDDLKVRVPLNKLKWEVFADRLLFDNTLVEPAIGSELPTSGIIQPS